MPVKGRVVMKPGTETLAICFKPMVNCWFGLKLWDQEGTLKNPNPGFIFGGFDRNPNHRAPNQHKKTIDLEVWNELMNVGSDIDLLKVFYDLSRA